MGMSLAVTVSESTAAIIRHAAASSFANTLGLKNKNSLGTYSSPNRKCVSETVRGRPIGRGTLISPT